MTNCNPLETKFAPPVEEHHTSCRSNRVAELTCDAEHVGGAEPHVGSAWGLTLTSCEPPNRSWKFIVPPVFSSAKLIDPDSVSLAGGLKCCIANKLHGDVDGGSCSGVYALSSEALAQRMPETFETHWHQKPLEVGGAEELVLSL